MRLTERLIKPIRLWSAVEGDNGYVGTSIAPGERLSDIRGIARPAEDRLTAEIYGERVAEMISIVTQDAVENGCFAAFDQEEAPTHRIISVKSYTRHNLALAERRQM